MTLNKRNIFLLDGVGAFVSVCLLGVVLPAIEHWIGMPRHILYALAIWAFGCMIYSLCCFWLVNHRDFRWLQGIMAANVLYCVLTVFLVAQYFTEMTIWGIAYFLGEIPVLLGLVHFERKVHRDCADG